MEGAKSHHEMFRRLQEQLAEISKVKFKDIPLGSGDNNDWSNILIWHLTYDHPEYFDDPLARMARGVPFLSEDFPKYYTMLLIQLEMTDLDNAMQHLERSLARFEYKLHKLKVGMELKVQGLDNFKSLPKENEDIDGKMKRNKFIDNLKAGFEDNKSNMEAAKEWLPIFGSTSFWTKIASFVENITTNPESLLDYGIVKSSKIRKEEVLKKIKKKVFNITERFAILKTPTADDPQQDQAYTFKKTNTAPMVTINNNDVVDIPTEFLQPARWYKSKVILKKSLFQNIEGTTAYINTLATLIDSYTAVEQDVAT